ncbi:MAG: ABC transporter ATP-binding protein [Parachlamydiaceae bacterium]|nr:ABC transporter ATP-binding protein [Parachlamydiaceae bacterium]
MQKNTLKTDLLSYAINGNFLIENISLEFTPGLVHGILGPNGSGKSTLLKNLSGIWKATSGSILWNHSSLLMENRQAASRIISLVPQNPQVNFDFLVEDIVAMGRYAHDSRYWATPQKNLLQNALEMVDAWHLRSRRITCLSHGERQRVYIARALVTEAPILLLDEPTASLDIRHQIEIWQLLKRLAHEGKIVIVSTHDILVAERYCDKIAVLNRGKCIANGAFETIMTPELLLNVFEVSSIR